MKLANLSNFEQDAVYHCADLELIAALPERSVNAFIADPPYGISNNVPVIINPDSGGVYNRVNEEWDREVPIAWMEALLPKLKAGGSVVAFGSYDCLDIIRAEARRLKWRIVNRVIWHKTDPAPNFSGRMMTYSTEEFVWYCPDGTGWTYNLEVAKLLNGGKNLHDVWDLGQTREKRVHPTQKSLRLMEWIVRLITNEGDLVVDPFMGSGTTLAAAHNWHRHYAGCDRELKYVLETLDRLRQPFSPASVVHANDLSGLPMFGGG